MKNYLYIMIFLISISSFSQNNVNEILKTINLSNKEVKIKVCKKDKYILNKDMFSSINNQCNIIEIYGKNSKKSFYSLVRLGNYKEYDLYTVISNGIINTKSKSIIPNSFSYFLLYNRVLDKLIYINSEMAIGSVCRENKKIILTYSINYLMNEIFLINDDFMPISSLRCFKDVSGVFKYFLSKYDYQNNFFIKKTNVKDDYIYDDSKLIPFEDLVFILNLNPEKYNYQKECYDSNCFSEIAKIALEKR
ncbi:hypothetical protein [Flavobacterium branchiophilum]|uniref:Uncharacterized protein n=1 Tax=Flavobacterium branchiophilum TaxID=55197 RepID=A0A543G3A4_9FLAO|nr:hypothetical protein [Flavobacterium branchiophilum]TQM40566.1 hypothetical protein BC670_1460 [Flavobacterium branchiophilum]GEM56737.1 hypothetical protein FB1_29580 [Flavobacterium branchiophilum NBRC 15030 = ATCC 35035]